MSAPQIKNIIFDLGGILINIDYPRTAQAFQALGIEEFEAYYSQEQQSSLFTDFELGKINEEEFRNGLRQLLACELNDSELDAAWNAMLLDFPPERLAYLEELRERYRLFLFSNTNLIHMRAVNQKLQALHFPATYLESIFERCYFSFHCGYRKPHPASFLKIVHQNQLDKAETLFVDDTLRHVQGARLAGLPALHLSASMNLVNLERHYIPEILKEAQDD